MVIQRLFSRTWIKLKDPEARKKKAQELLEARKKINPRREQIKSQRLEDIRKLGLGETNEKIRLEDIESRFKRNMSNLNAYKDSITDNASGKLRKKLENEAKEAAEIAKKEADERLIKEASERLKKNLKRGGKITLGVATAAGLTYGGKKLYDHQKNKKKFDEARGNIINK